ncbi:MAG: hypothetical protein JXJ04_04975, partial [Spirochaetales bacterium]|nr:hypothetical protein [Spirochaetales bacterium]
MKPETYLSRGVSPTKDDVKNAIKKQSKGLFPGAFCKIIGDILGDDTFCNVMHADGAGTKSQVAYIYACETGDKRVFRNIAQDSIVMNLDDLLCVGAVDNFVVSNTIGRNAHRIDGEIITHIIDGYQKVVEMLKGFDITVSMSGGETADVGDIVSTIIVDSTIFVRLKREDVIVCDNIKDGDQIVGLASFGKARYEDHYNSG